jgi:hypothetical protein
MAAPLSLTKVRADLYKIVDGVLETGNPVEIERRGKRVRIVPVRPASKLDNLVKRPGTLVGDPEDVEQLRDRHTRISADEMHHAVMRAAEAVVAENLVRVGHEIPIGEEEQFDQTDDFAVARRGSALRRRNYVSHIDIFLGKRYKNIRPAAISLRHTLPTMGEPH